MSTDDISFGEKYTSLKQMAMYRPLFTLFLIGLSFAATLLEAVGLTFLFPIIEAAQSGSAQIEDTSRPTELFIRGYEFLDIAFTLENMMLGVAAVITIRYTASFLAKWLAVKLRIGYERKLKTYAYRLSLCASSTYYDAKGTDEILNTIITQTRYAARIIQNGVKFFQQILLSLVYAGIAFAIAPVLMILAGMLLGGITAIIRFALEPAYTVGDRVAEANEQLQENIQAGTQGITDVKLFGLTDDFITEFSSVIDTYVSSSVNLRRNKVAINSFYQLMTGLLIFLIVYVSVTVLNLTIASLGVFLFAMFRLTPRVSTLNSLLYSIEGDLPHLVRTHEFIDSLAGSQESEEGQREMIDSVETLAFEDVSFAYEDEQVLNDISFSVDRNEFIGFIGQSGAGKSTIVSLVARLYKPDSGCITANGVQIDEFDIEEWREKVAMVQQDPHIFNETLRFNLTLGNQVPDNELEEIVNISCVSEFLEELPEGYDTELGEDGVKLSGGQRQRVALARALIKDAEILVLDEATSDLDSSLEQQIQRAIEHLEGEYLTIAIAHRLSTVERADTIYTIEDGSIVEAGSHKELLKNDGTYADLYAVQGHS